MMGWGGWGWGGWLAMSLVMLAVWALVIAGVVALVQSTRSRNGRPPGDRGFGDEAGRILAERFARGELTEEQYTHQRDLLGSR